MSYQKLLLLIIPFFIISCSESDQASNTENQIENRWYTKQQVKQGFEIYQTNCATCHKPDASGTTNWKQVDANGKYPPPPLNGDAHAWHHSLDVLKRTVWFGGVRLGGTMPAFKEKLTEQEIEATLAWVQTNWSNRIYNEWQKRNK